MERKPRGYKTVPYFSKILADKMEIDQNLIQDVIWYVYKASREAFKDPEVNSVELSGLGTFNFSHKRCMDLIENINPDGRYKEMQQVLIKKIEDHVRKGRFLSEANKKRFKEFTERNRGVEERPKDGEWEFTGGSGAGDSEEESNLPQMSLE